MQERNEAFKQHMKRGSYDLHKILQKTRNKPRKEKKRAKRQWQLNFALKCRKKDFQTNPKEAWSNIFKLMEDYQSHHRNFTPKNLKDSHGKEATTNDQNLQIMSDHYKKVFNNHAQIDPTIIDKIPQRPIQHELRDTPTLNETKKPTKHMKNDKAPKTSKVTTDMLKKPTARRL
jgi:hypothetical protein